MSDQRGAAFREAAQRFGVSVGAFCEQAAPVFQKLGEEWERVMLATGNAVLRGRLDRTPPSWARRLLRRAALRRPMGRLWWWVARREMRSSRNQTRDLRESG